MKAETDTETERVQSEKPYQRCEERARDEERAKGRKSSRNGDDLSLASSIGGFSVRFLQCDISLTITVQALSMLHYGLSSAHATRSFPPSA